MNKRTQNELIARLRRDADRICHRFDLRYRSIEPERANVKSRYGICYDDGSIKIRLRHVATGDPLKYSSLVNTLCHELAHLKHFDHGPHFKTFYARLLEWARREGIYRPGPRTGAAADRPVVGSPTPPEPGWLRLQPAADRAGTPVRLRPAALGGHERGRNEPERTAPRQRPVQLDLFATG